MTELQAAGAARAQLLREQQVWAMEKEKLDLLAAVLGDEAGDLAAEAAESTRQLSQLRKQMAGMTARRQRLKLIEAMIDTVAERLENALDAAAAEYLPGLVPADTAAEIIDPARRLTAAADRLDAAERHARKPGIELVLGDLGDVSATVKLLRLGGVAAWWSSLDGRKAGTARMIDGKLRLTEAAASQDADAIKRAFAIVEARAAPGWVMLPAGHVMTPDSSAQEPE